MKNKNKVTAYTESIYPFKLLQDNEFEIFLVLK